MGHYRLEPIHTREKAVTGGGEKSSKSRRDRVLQRLEIRVLPGGRFGQVVGMFLILRRTSDRSVIGLRTTSIR